jgi:hypothetical protein
VRDCAPDLVAFVQVSEPFGQCPAQSLGSDRSRSQSGEERRQDRLAIGVHP